MPGKRKQSRGQKTEPRTKSRPEDKKQQQVIILARGVGRECFETATNAAKLVIL